MVEQPPQVSFPRPPRPAPRGPTRGQLWRRRVAALAVLAAAVAGAFYVVKIAIHGVKRAVAPATTSVVAPKVIRVLFPEGFTRREMAARIAGESRAITAKAYLAATASSPLPASFGGDRKQRSVEGFLFPATYDLYETDRASRLADKQLAAFRRNWAKVNLRYARSRNLTPYDVLIIASMVEKEVRAPAERRLVAAVIYNRLRARMPLGIDATIRYALNVSPKRSLTQAQLDNPTPYNTRLHRGLPPTPIASPGLASMQAAARPAPVAYLYFVRKPDKVHHFFTADAAEFDRYLAEHGYGPR